jgi:outer membrane protein assembly factor BamB
LVAGRAEHLLGFQRGRPGRNCRFERGDLRSGAVRVGWLILFAVTACRTPAPPPVITPPEPVAEVIHEVDSGTAEPPPPDDWYEVAPSPSLATLERSVLHDAGVPISDRQHFPEPYSTLDGVFTFRGNPQRTGGAFGTIPDSPSKLSVAWVARTTDGAAPWFGGSGWTGQSAIVRWPAVVRHSMTKLGARRFDDDFIEVLQGSLDGHVYFLDLLTGRQTRPPLDTRNPIKGSVSVDPRGYPLLFVGQGIPDHAPIGLRVYDLITHREVFFLPGHDPDAPRHEWGAFDSSGLLNRRTDTYVVGGENGLVYLLHLNTRFDPIALTLTLAPEVTRYRYHHPHTDTFGVENSLSVTKNLAFFGDNSGLLQALDLRTFTPLWAFDAGDDTDASLTIDVEAGHPFLYTGCEVDRTGPKGKTHLRKLDALTGAQQWDVTRACLGATGPPKKIDAGLFATNVVGKGDVADLVYFTLSRCPGPENGAVLALDKATGREVWKVDLPHFSWSSPTLLTSASGKSYLLQGGIDGVVRLLDARTGVEVAHVQLEGGIESSPAVFNEHVVLGTRADRIYGLTIH